MSSCLVDINVWIALSISTHTHHQAAALWFGRIESAAYFCRTSQLGFLRLLTNQHVMGVDVRTQREAWNAYDNLLSDPLVGFISEPAAAERIFRDLTQNPVSATKTWTDAYLAAVAVAAGLKIVTLDQSFRKVPGLESVTLGLR